MWNKETFKIIIVLKFFVIYNWYNLVFEKVTIANVIVWYTLKGKIKKNTDNVFL